MNLQLRKSTAGVTLLEIMLVLAIAAMIILMSVRYYKNATASQQANAVLEQITVITSAADSLAQGSTGYAAVTTTTVQNVVGGAAYLNTPWGAMTLGAIGSTGFSITMPTLPSGVCSIVSSNLSASTKYTVAANCTTVTYNSTL